MTSSSPKSEWIMTVLPETYCEMSVNNVMERKKMENKTKTAGINGYPHTLYGRSANGILFRKTKTPKTIIP